MADTPTAQQSSPTPTQPSSGEDIFWAGIERIQTLLDDVYVAACQRMQNPINFLGNDFEEITDLIKDMAPFIGSIYAGYFVLEPGSLKTIYAQISERVLDDLTLLQSYCHADATTWPTVKQQIYPLITRLRMIIGAGGVLTVHAKPKSESSNSDSKSDSK